MYQVKVSVIMPVYNSKKNLERSIKCVLNQSFKDFEFIIVDDGSTDCSKKIIQIYSINDNRIKVFFNSNHGVSFTRNFGINKARGEYICFIDAGDLYNKYYLESMVNEIEKKDADLIFCKYLMEYNESSFKKNDYLNYGIDDYTELYGQKSFEEACEKGLGIPVWNKIFKKRIVLENNIFFNENLSYGEDMFFCWKMFLVSKKTFFLDAVLYFYRIENFSATSKYHSNLYKNYFDAYNEITIFSQEKGLYDKYLAEYISISFAQRLPAMVKMVIRQPSSIFNKLDSVKIILTDKKIRWALENKYKKITPESNKLYFFARKKNTTFVLLYAYFIECKVKVVKRIKTRRIF